MGPATTAKKGMARACHRLSAKKAAHSSTRPQRQQPIHCAAAKETIPSKANGKYAKPATLKPVRGIEIQSFGRRGGEGAELDIIVHGVGRFGETKFLRQGKSPKVMRINETDGDAGDQHQQESATFARRRRVGRRVGRAEPILQRFAE